MKKYLAGLIAVLAIIPHTTLAYTAIKGQDRLRLDQNIDDNAYVAGGNVDVTGNISGDLFLAGWEILVSGNVGDNAFISGGNVETSGTLGNDVMVAGGNVRIRGPVKGDLKAAGGNVILESSGSGDVNMAWGSVRIAKNVQIGKDMGLAGGNVVFDWHVLGKADIFTNNLDMDGIIDKDATIRISNLKNLHIGPNAKILGKLTYSANDRLPDLERIATGGADYQGKMEFGTNDNSRPLYGLVGAYVFYRLLLLLVLGSLTLYLFRRSIHTVADTVRKTPGKSFFYGILYFVLMPLAILIAFITVVGIPVGFLWIAIYAFSFVFSKLLTLVVFSELINTKWSESLTASWQRWGIFTILAILLAVLSGIDFIAALFAFGAIMVLIGNRWKRS